MLLNQTLELMFLSIMLMPTGEMAQKLLNNDNPVLQWFGLNMLNQLASQNNKPDVFFSAIKSFSSSEQISFAGWFLLQQKTQSNEGFLKESIVKLVQFLPEHLNKQNIKNLLDSLRGHMKSLAYNGYWIYEEILYSLLKQKRIKMDELALFWFNDLKQELPLNNTSGDVLFSNTYQGELTNLAAYFCIQASAEKHEELLNEIKKLQKQTQNIVRQPLASTINYKKWNGALYTALWLEAFVILLRLYQLQDKDKSCSYLKSLQMELNEIIQLRSYADWQQQRSQLVDFYYQSKKMIAETKELT